jgi:DNA-binding beta-propeller fold protein YncE
MVLIGIPFQQTSLIKTLIATSITTATSTSTTTATSTTTNTMGYVFVPYNVTPALVLSDKLKMARGIALHPQTGDVYIIDSYKLCIFHYNGSFVSCTATWSTTNGKIMNLVRPQSITVTPEGRLIIADLYRVMVIDNGIVTRVWGSKGKSGSNLGQFNYPSDTAVDDSGRIYVADYYNKRVQILDPNTNNITLLDAPVLYDSLVAIAINTVSGDVMVAMSKGYVLIFNDRGEYKQKVSLSHRSDSIFVDVRGFSYVTDIFYDAVHIYDHMWKLKQTFGKQGTCSGCFNKPIDILVNNNNGDILVADNQNNNIQVFSSIS